MDFLPDEILKQQLTIENILENKGIGYESVDVQKIGPQWIFKVFTTEKPKYKSTYIKGIPLVFEQVKKLSKR